VAVELGGEIVDEGTVLVAERGRLLSRIDQWPHVSLAFAEACAERALELSARARENARVKGLATRRDSTPSAPKSRAMP
jgi:hypothetical protein